MKRINLYSFPPLADVSGNRAFISNGNMILGYKVVLPEVFSLSEKDYESLHATWFRAFKNLPAHTVIHKQDIYLKSAFDAENLPDTSFLEKATRNHFCGRQYLGHQCYLFFCWPANRSFHKARFINPFTQAKKKTVHAENEKLRRFSQAIQECVNFLNQDRNLQLFPLKEAKIQNLTRQYFNGYNADIDTDVILGDHSIRIGKNYWDVMALQHETAFLEEVQTSRPASRFTSDEFSFHQGFIDGIGLELYENHMVNQILVMDDNTRWRKQLEKKRETLKKSAGFGTQNLVVLEKIEAVLQAMNQDEQARIVRGQLNILYWDQDPVRLSGIAGEIKTCCKQLDIRPYVPQGEARKQYFLNTYFGFTSNFTDEDLYVSDLKHALCIWLHSANYKSDDHGIIFNDRQFNIPVIKDVWDERKKRIKARNFAIFAPTGEGKSFLANSILRQFFEQGVRLVIIDLGGSYTKFAGLYADASVVLRYQPGQSLGINPFYLPVGAVPTAEHLEELAIFLFELTSPGVAVKKEENVALKKMLQAYYTTTACGYDLQGFYNFIDKEQDLILQKAGMKPEYFEVARFLHILSEYVGDGIYGYLFRDQGEHTYCMEDKRLIIFELDEVKDNQEILSVMLKLIKSAIQRSIWRNRDEKGIILFDEFAKQLKFSNVLESVEFYYQAIRKQNGAIGIVLQSINQLPENSTAASILENTQVIYSLRNEKGYDDLVSRLKLSAHDLNQLKSITNNLSGSQKYTEVFIKIGKQSNVYRLEVPAEAYAAYLTDGPENETILKLFKASGNMESAIRNYLTQKNSR